MEIKNFHIWQNTLQDELIIPVKPVSKAKQTASGKL
jgi:hypothetical protein